MTLYASESSFNLNKCRSIVKRLSNERSKFQLGLRTFIGDKTKKSLDRQEAFEQLIFDDDDTQQLNTATSLDNMTSNAHPYDTANSDENQGESPSVDVDTELSDDQDDLSQVDDVDNGDESALDDKEEAVEDKFQLTFEPPKVARPVPQYGPQNVSTETKSSHHNDTGAASPITEITQEPEDIEPPMKRQRLETAPDEMFCSLLKVQQPAELKPQPSLFIPQ